MGMALVGVRCHSLFCYLSFFNVSCFSFHFSNSRCPSSLSKKACILWSKGSIKNDAQLILSYPFLLLPIQTESERNSHLASDSFGSEAFAFIADLFFGA